ncbi:MAG TPA: MipA/OmpV family protein [Cellvibrio sp.]|nr:MipA/OmpV family protein [Cellvibrio sp.]
MEYLTRTINVCLFAATLSCAVYSVAEESPDSDKPQTNSNSRDGYYLSVGIGHRIFESPLREEINGFQVVFNSRYQWNGLFVELGFDPTSDKNLPAVGYNFYNTDHWNFDLITASTDGRHEFNYRVDGEAKLIFSETTRGTGLRAQGSWGNTSLQVIALPYFHEEFTSHSAVEYASLWAGHRWQIKNWSVNGLVGAKYRSRGLTDYLYGVTESEADKVVDAYEPSSSIDYTAQIDFTYPISKKLVFQIYSSHTVYSDEALNSPMVKLARKWDDRPEKRSEFGILLNYVF